MTCEEEWQRRRRSCRTEFTLVESLSIERFRTQKTKRRRRKKHNVFAEEPQPHKATFGSSQCMEKKRRWNIWKKQLFWLCFSHFLLSIIITQIFKRIKKKEGSEFFKKITFFYFILFKVNSWSWPFQFKSILFRFLQILNFKLFLYCAFFLAKRIWRKIQLVQYFRWSLRIDETTLAGDDFGPQSRELMSNNNWKSC